MEEWGEIAAPGARSMPFREEPCLRSQMGLCGVSAADRLRSEVPEGPAAGHETQTRTMGFHGYVASPLGCSGPAVAAGGFDRGRSGVVDVVFLPPLKHYQKDNALGGYKEKRTGTRSLHAINIHLVFRFVKRDSTKKVDFSEKDIFISSNARLPQLRFPLVSRSFSDLLGVHPG